MFPSLLNPPTSRLSQSADFTFSASFINSHWRSTLHMVMCRFQGYFLKSSNPLLLLPSPKGGSHVCLLLFSAHRITGINFLEFTDMH